MEQIINVYFTDSTYGVCSDSEAEREPDPVERFMPQKSDKITIDKRKIVQIFEYFLDKHVNDRDELKNRTGTPQHPFLK